MKIPKSFAYIGLCLEFLHYFKGIEYHHTFYKKNETRGLFAAYNDKTGLHDLLIIRFEGAKKFVRPTAKEVKQNKKSIQQAISVYQTFMDFDPSNVTSYEMGNHQLKKFGDSMNIVYRSDKWTKKNHDYEHVFYDGKSLITSCPQVFINKSSNGIDPSVIYIYGVDITKRGIEG